MTTTLILSTLLLPLSLAALAKRRYAPWLAMIAPLPAIAAASLASSTEILTLDWMLLGMRMAVDDRGRLFLAASAIVWMVAAVYAAGSLRRSPDAARFRLFFQLAMAGNFALILAQDMMTFFLGFTLMGLSAYGLVAHERSFYARRAGRLYLSWTMLGEMILFCALVLVAAGSGGLDFAALQATPPSHFAAALVIIGFGIKLALPGLHVWLPLTYAAAPAAGAAVLSGPMISAGLLGWMRFLPPGNQALAPWGEFLIATGVVGAAYGVVVGLLQRSPKVVLGYSSMSKMGVLTSGFGIALAYPDMAPLMLSALTLYAIHHMMVKSALFIGVDLLKRSNARAWVVTGLMILCMALAGAPLTSGALAKATLIKGLPESTAWFSGWLTMSAFGSTLLMGRLLYLASNCRIAVRRVDNFVLAPWAALVVLIVVTPFFVGTPTALLSTGLPVALGVVVILAVWRYRPQFLSSMVARIAPGDILNLVPGGTGRVRNSLLLTRKKMYGYTIRIRQDQRWQSITAALSKSRRTPMTPLAWSWVGTLWITLLGLAILAIATG